jgi:hypothetical protein
LRIAVENGWYHVLNRGIDGRQLLPDDRARRVKQIEKLLKVEM